MCDLTQIREEALCVGGDQRRERRGPGWRSPHTSHLMQSAFHDKLSVGVSDGIDYSGLGVCYLKSIKRW